MMTSQWKVLYCSSLLYNIDNTVPLLIAIGLAFGEEMIQHPDMMKVLFKNTTPSADNAWIKMAMVMHTQCNLSSYRHHSDKLKCLG